MPESSQRVVQQPGLDCTPRALYQPLQGKIGTVLVCLTLSCGSHFPTSSFYFCFLDILVSVALPASASTLFLSLGIYQILKEHDLEGGGVVGTVRF